MGFTLHRHVEEKWPGHAEGMSRMRTSEAKIAARSLLCAAGICLVHVVIVAYTMKNSGVIVDAPRHEDLIFGSVVLMCAFAICGMWAKFNAVLAATFALGLFIGLGVRDFLTYSTIFEAGIVSKSILFFVLMRGFMNAVMSKTI